MTADSPSSPYSGRIVSGRYRLTRLLGQGGFGFVYEAEHVKLPRRFAIKFLHRQHEIDEQFVKRFEREARITAQLDHPAIVAVTDYGEDEALGHYFAMEYLNGEDLASLIRRAGPVTSAEAVRLMLSIVDAFAFAHEQGVIHRDVKSANIYLVNTASAHDVPKILDFGIARIQETSREDAEKLTRSGAMMGSAAYISPEQALGQPIDQRTDIYSLGIVFYELVTGRVPFKADSALAMLAKHVSEAPMPPSQVPGSPPVNPFIEMTILKCLRKNREDRYASAREFLADLEKARDGIASGVVPEAVRESIRTLTQEMKAERAQQAIEAAETRQLNVLASSESHDPGLPTGSMIYGKVGQSGSGALRAAILVLAGLLVIAVGFAWYLTAKRDVPSSVLPTMSSPPAQSAGVPPSSTASPTSAASGEKTASLPATVVASAPVRPAPIIPPPPPVEPTSTFPLQVTSEPSGATVRWKGDAQVLGSTPFVLELRPTDDQRVLTVEKAGFRAREHVVQTAEARAAGKIDLALEKAPSKPAVQAAPARRSPPKRPAGRPKSNDDDWEDL